MNKPCDLRSIILRDEIDCSLRQAQNAVMLNSFKPNPVQPPQPGSGALAIGLLGMALCGSTEAAKRRHRYSGVCPHCGAPVDPSVVKCAYCDCYYD